MTVDICVVVPVYNRASIVLKTLDSIAAQSLRPARLVVVDDGSTDASAVRVASWLETHRHEFHGRLLRQPNHGVSAARNLGLADSENCSMVAFLDSDDLWPCDFLERTSQALAGCPTAVAASCDRETHTGKPGGPELHDLAELARNPLVWMLEHGAGISSATLFRKAAIVRHGGFNESLFTGEDAALYMPLSLDGPWLHVPGRPVNFDRSLTNRGVGDGNLSHKFHDNNRRWARVYENFIIHGGGSQVLDAEDYRHRLGRIWYRAGREFVRNGQMLEARQCFLKSLQWNPWSFKARQRLAQTYLRPGALRGILQRRTEKLQQKLTRLDGDQFAPRLNM